jgi:hypothetical protein
MIIVTGTKRSGTSMWMQILLAAGFPSIGTAFPGVWERSIKEANPFGFYESKFRQGVYFATNPDPETGAFLHSSQVKRHAVKIFIPGLIRTELAYLNRVISTMRSWREYCSSLKRLHSMEDSFREETKRSGEAAQQSFPDEQVDSNIRTGQLPPALEWWFENYDLIRNVATRRFPFHMVTYDRLLRDPSAELSKVLQWLGEGSLPAALLAVKPEARTQNKPMAPDELVADFADFFDEFYEVVDTARALDASFIEKLNETNRVLTERWKEIFLQRVEAARNVERTPR